MCSSESLREDTFLLVTAALANLSYLEATSLHLIWAQDTASSILAKVTAMFLDWSCEFFLAPLIKILIKSETLTIRMMGFYIFM